MEKNLKKTQENDYYIGMTPYAWHELLEELEYLFRIIGRDKVKTIRLYENIASQLSDIPVKVESNKKSKKPKEPLGRVIKENTVGDCPWCASTTIKRFGWFGRSLGCINLECKNYHKHN